MSPSGRTKKVVIPTVTSDISAVSGDGDEGGGLHRRNDAAASNSDGVPGVASAPRSRRADARRQQRKETEDAANDRGPWLNAEQAAVYLALPTVKALYQAVRRGEIPVYRFGERLRFKRDELDALLLKGRVLTPPNEGLSSLTRRPLAGEGR